MKRSVPLLFTCVTVLIAPMWAVGPARGTVYFVAPDGFDGRSGNAGGPLGTIAEAARRAGAGDMVVVTPGVYRESITVKRSGTAEAPLVFRGLPGAVMTSPDPTRSLSAFDIQPTVANVTIQGFEIGGGYAETIFVRTGAHDITLAGLHLHDNRAGIWIGGARRVSVRDCLMQGHYRSGIRIFAGAEDIEVIDTRVEGSDDGLGCNGDADGFTAEPSTADLYFEGVEAIANSEDGFDLQGRNSTVRRAIARDNGCSAMKLGGGGSVENFLAENSRVGFSAGADALLQNATLVGNALGMRLLGSGHTVSVRNSIITGPGKAISYASGVTLVEHHNIFHRPKAKDRLIVRMTPQGEILYSGADINTGVWRDASGQGHGTAAVDPGFAPGGSRPGSSSPAIDSGERIGSPLLDLDGRTRPAGAAVDLGAFEWIAEAPTVVINRAVMVHRADGSGRIRLRAEVSPASRFDPSSDTVAIALRSKGGAVLHVQIAPGDWHAVHTYGGSILRAVQSDGEGHRMRVMVRIAAGKAVLRLDTGGADLWALGGSNATIDVALGPIRARATAALHSVGRVSFVR